MPKPGEFNAVEKYIESVKQKAEHLVKHVLPERLSALSDTLSSPEFNVEDVTSLHQDINILVPTTKSSNKTTVVQKNVPEPEAEKKVTTPDGQSKTECQDAGETGTENAPVKKRKLEESIIEINVDRPKILKNEQGTRVHVSQSGPVPCNEKIVHLINLGKPIVQQLAKDANLLKMWITFLIPKIEDGNNFGVEIQEAILSEVQIIEAEASVYGDQVARYYKQRGDVLSEITKFPMLNDYRKLVEEIDEAQFIRIRMTFSDVRDHYATLYEIIDKNYYKLVNPRTTNTENLY